MGTLSIKLYNQAKGRFETHGSCVKDFEDLGHSDISGDNINYALACNFHRLTRDKGPKSWCESDSSNNVGTERLACSTVVKYFESLFNTLQIFWHNHPDLQGSSDNSPQ